MATDDWISITEAARRLRWTRHRLYQWLGRHRDLLMTGDGKGVRNAPRWLVCWVVLHERLNYQCQTCGRRLIKPRPYCTPRCAPPRTELTQAEAAHRIGISRQAVQQKLIRGVLPDLQPETVAAYIAGARWRRPRLRPKPDPDFNTN